MSFEIDISCGPSADVIDCHRLQAAILHALSVEQVGAAVLSVTVVDNSTIHRLNLTHLQHDFPTDVISFPLEWQSPEFASPPQTTSGRSADARIEGEIVVSLEFAEEMAPRAHWAVQDELTLYVVHGMLHICGYDDLSPDEKAVMRTRERAILDGLGLTPQYPDDDGPEDDPPGTTEWKPPSANSQGEGHQ